MSLVTELERLADALSDTADGTSPLAWSSVAERIAKNLGVKTDEVGILGSLDKVAAFVLSRTRSPEKCRLHSALEQFRVGCAYRAREPSGDRQ